MTQQDATFLKMALAEAWKSAGHTRPNPPVGAVVVRNGEVIGRGRHRRCGGDHAEVAAIKDALRHLTSIRPLKALRPLAGATVYVTLEPCSRPGRVGACTDALIAAGVARVVWAEPDPNPVNRGRAARVLAKAGILKGRKAVCYPGMESWLEGAVIGDGIVVTDGNITTAKGPAVTPFFALKLLEILCGRATAEKVAEAFLMPMIKGASF